MAEADAAFWRLAPDGVRVAVKVQPKSRQPGLRGLVPGVDGMRLRIGVNEPAEDGRANRAVCATLARALDVPESAVRVAVGAGNRDKVLAVTGDPAVLSVRLCGL